MVRLKVSVSDSEDTVPVFAVPNVDAVVVTNYLWRPLWPTLIASIVEGGLLLCETFADGNATASRSPAFRLRLHGSMIILGVQEVPEPFGPSLSGRSDPCAGGPAPSGCRPTGHRGS